MRSRRMGLMVVLACLGVLAGFAGESKAQSRPANYSEFEKVDVVEDNGQLVLTDIGRSKIECGCSICDRSGPMPTCGTPDDTYLYFPVQLNSTGSPMFYVMGYDDGIDDKPLVINRTTSLFLAGADQRDTRLKSIDPSKPMFKVMSAPLINVTRMTLRPNGDGQVQTPGTEVFRFHNQPPTFIEFEMLDSFIEGGKLGIKGPGSFRLQNVSANTGGLTDSVVELNHADADLTIVGGLFIAQVPEEPPVPPEGVYDWLESCTPDCGNDPDGCPNNPCDAPVYHIRQKQGRLQVYSTGFTAGNGEADIRIDTAADKPHVIAGSRSEGAGGPCGTSYPGSFVFVENTSEAVDIVLLNSEGAWITGCENVSFGDSHLMDYNGAGTVWLIGNQSFQAAGVLARGGSAGTFVAIGNHYFGNTDTPPDPPDPTNLLPSGGTVIHAGNPYSLGEFCDWCTGNCPAACDSIYYCSHNSNLACDPEEQPDPCLPSGQCVLSLVTSVFADLGWSLMDYTFIPDLPGDVVSVPDPLTLPPVTSASDLEGMIDADNCRLDLLECWTYYPEDCANPGDYVCPEPGFPSCDPLSHGACAGCRTRPSFTSLDDHCWIQAAFNKAIELHQPVYIPKEPVPALSHTIDRPLYWIHSLQEDQEFQLPITPLLGGGWIAGQDNDVRIVGGSSPAWATEGMAQGVIQGIHFETLSNPSATHATVQVENDTDGVGYETAHLAFHDCDFTGGRRAFSLCADSGTQCDTIMTVNGTFSDAHIGWANGGANALHNIAYNATLVDNAIAFGQDPNHSAEGRGSFNVLHADISGSTEKDLELQGGFHPYFFHGVESDTPVLVDETAVQYVSWQIMFDHSNLNQGNAYDDDGPLARFRQAGGFFFLHSDIGNGWLDLERVTGSEQQHTAKIGLKMMTEAPHWRDNDLESPQEAAFELEFCDSTLCPGLCQEGTCPPARTTHGSCLDRTLETWLWCLDPNEAVSSYACGCTGRFGCSQAPSLTWACD